MVAADGELVIRNGVGERYGLCGYLGCLGELAGKHQRVAQRSISYSLVHCDFSVSSKLQKLSRPLYSSRQRLAMKAYLPREAVGNKRIWRTRKPIRQFPGSASTFFGSL